MIEGTYLPKVMRFIRIACAIFNRYFHAIQSEKSEHPELAARMLSLVGTENKLQKEIEEKNLENRFLVANWRKITVEDECLRDFPNFSYAELEKIFCGEYQLRLGARYVKQHMKDNGELQMYFYKHSDVDGKLIAARLQSRFRSVVKHQLWTKYHTELVGISQIVGLCCKCQSGARTIGSCSHCAAVRCVLFILNLSRFRVFYCTLTFESCPGFTVFIL